MSTSSWKCSLRSMIPCIKTGVQLLFLDFSFSKAYTDFIDPVGLLQATLYDVDKLLNLGQGCELYM